MTAFVIQETENEPGIFLPSDSTNIYTDAYQIKDSLFGTVTKVTISKKERIMITNGLPNHPTGAFPNEGNPNQISKQQLRYTFPLSPKFTGEAKWVRETGVALNGVKFEPETAERFICESGEVYRLEAVQNLLDLGLDSNNAHVQPTGAYHYHGVPTNLVKQLDEGEDLILIGFAKDGYPMYYSKSGQYKPSYVLSDTSRTGNACEMKTPHQRMTYDIENTAPDGTFVSDWTFQEGSGDLDECNGIQIGDTYIYLVTDEYPFVSRCLMGEFKEAHPHGPPPGMQNPQGPPPGGIPHSRSHGHDHH